MVLDIASNCCYRKLLWYLDIVMCVINIASNCFIGIWYERGYNSFTALLDLDAVKEVLEEV